MSSVLHDPASAAVIFAVDGNSTYTITSAGSSSGFSGLGSCAVTYGDLGAGARVYLSDGRDTFVLDGLGNPSTLVTAGGCALAIGDFGAGPRL